MVKVNISGETKTLQEVTPKWIAKTVNRNRVLGTENTVEINIDSPNANLKLVNNGTEVKASNEIENRIVFLWNDIVISKHNLDPNALYDFLKRMDEWVSFVPKA